MPCALIFELVSLGGTRTCTTGTGALFKHSGTHLI